MSKREHVRDYITLSDCYDRLNAALFGSGLGGCVLTFEDKGQHFGYYRPEGFVARDGAKRKDEICLNPRHFLTNSGDLELLQTLAHEMCHQWQEHCGTPSRSNYHNREWAAKMRLIGLVPSSTGKPGGRETGQTMADYPQEGGIFLAAAGAILKDKELITYYKREAFRLRASQSVSPGDSSDAESPASLQEAVAAFTVSEGGDGLAAAKPERPSKMKFKYTCPECQAKAWGKDGLKLICGTCWDGSAPVYLDRS